MAVNIEPGYVGVSVADPAVLMDLDTAGDLRAPAEVRS